jgi:hypothetical protein
MHKIKRGGDGWLQPVSESQKVPVAVQSQQHYAPDGGTMDVLSTTLFSLNNNPYIIAVFMLLLNLGGRSLSMELTKKQEEFLQHRWLRPVIFFTVIFVATRNLAVAFWMTFFLFLILWIVANEKSPFCLVPGWREDNPSEKIANYETNTKVLESLKL